MQDIEMEIAKLEDARFEIIKRCNGVYGSVDALKLRRIEKKLKELKDYWERRSLNDQARTRRN